MKYLSSESAILGFKIILILKIREQWVYVGRAYSNTTTSELHLWFLPLQTIDLHILHRTKRVNGRIVKTTYSKPRKTRNASYANVCLSKSSRICSTDLSYVYRVRLKFLQSIITTSREMICRKTSPAVRSNRVIWFKSSVVASVDWNAQTDAWPFVGRVAYCKSSKIYTFW